MKGQPSFKFEKQASSHGYNLVIGVDEVGRGALAGPVVAGAVAFTGAGSVISSRARPRELRTFFRMGVGVRNPAHPRVAKNYPRHHLGKGFNWLDLGIKDSKKLTAKRRQELDKLIRKHAVWGIGEAGVATINRYGIVKATEKAMRLAIKHVARSAWRVVGPPRATSYQPRAFVLVDAFHIKYIPGVGLKNQMAIVKGDQKVLSIAAASIIAKVYRDRIVAKIHRANRAYRSYGWDRNKGYGTKKHLAVIKRRGLTKLHRLAFVKKFI